MPALASLLHKFCSVIDQPIVFVDTNLNVIQTNPVFRKLLKISEKHGEQISLFSLPDGNWNSPELKQMLCEQERTPYGVIASSEIEWTLGECEGETICVMVYSITEFENDEPTQFLLVIRQNSDSPEQRAKQTEIGKLLSQATAIPSPRQYFKQTLELCLFAVGEMTGWPIGHIWFMPEIQNHQLVSSDMWRNSSDRDILPMRKLTQDSIFTAESGFPGMISQARKLLWIENIQELIDPHRQEVMKSMGIRSAIGFPVHVGGQVRAILEFFDTKSAPHSEQIVQLCSQISQLAGRVIERQETTELLREARLTSARATLARSQFLANMSHELRTPMTSILGMLDLSLEEKLPWNVRDNLRTAHNSAQEMLELLNDILDHASLESDRLTLIEQPFRLCELLEQTMAPYVERTTQKGLRWILVVSPDIPDRLVGDAVRLKQVLDYLLDNAVKFTEHGEIEVQVMLDRPCTDDETRLSITIGDTGPGFSTDEMHQLFQGFTQADSSFARRHRGAGLGLAICSALINRLGGDFTIESQVGSGTRSMFTIPLKQQKHYPECLGDGLSKIEVSRENHQTDAPAARSLMILLAEDTPANQKLIESILLKRGHRVSVAANGKEALEQISKTGFDVVIMDLQMPMMDGYQATAAIRDRERQTDRHIPIIALTAHSTASDRNACLEAGMDAYLSKPINVAELIRVTEASAQNSVPRSVEKQGNPQSNGTPDGEFSIDRDSIMKRLGGDEELFRSFIEVFTEDSPAMVQQLRSAIAESNSRLIQRSAHSLRGLAANFNATGVVDLTSKLEQAGKDGDLSEASSLMTQLNEAMEQLRDTLAAYQS